MWYGKGGLSLDRFEYNKQSTLMQVYNKSQKFWLNVLKVWLSIDMNLHY